MINIALPSILSRCPSPVGSRDASHSGATYLDPRQHPITKGSGGANTSGESDLAPSSLARRLSELAQDLDSHVGSDDLLAAIAAAAVVNVPAATYAGVTLISKRGVLTTPVRTDNFVDRIDRLQFETREGPCLVAALDHHTARTDDLRIETRWPSFAPAAADIGIRSMLAVPLRAGQDTLGALNLYSRQPDAFDHDAEDLALLLGGHAALAIIGSDRRGNFVAALGSRDIIGQAKGILMERHKVDALAAFQLLIVASQRTNRKLHTIAEMVTTTGQDLTTENVRAF